MEKDFDSWHELKTKINKKITSVFFEESQIWFASIGVNVGFEQDGRGDTFLRPVLVFKKFNKSVCLCIPLTTQTKEGSYYFSFISSKNKKHSAILSQIRLLDARRFVYRVGVIGPADFLELKRKLTQLLA